MEVNNPRYKNQGIHVISAIFTVDKGITKVLIIRHDFEHDCDEPIALAFPRQEKVLGKKR